MVSHLFFMSSFMGIRNKYDSVYNVTYIIRKGNLLKHVSGNYIIFWGDVPKKSSDQLVHIHYIYAEKNFEWYIKLVC